MDKVRVVKIVSEDPRNTKVYLSNGAELDWLTEVEVISTVGDITHYTIRGIVSPQKKTPQDAGSS